VITVRATTVESFRLYMDPDCELISVDEIEARLRGESTEVSDEARLRMDRGTAFHDAVATGAVTIGDFSFMPSTLYKARAGLDGAVSEAEGSMVVDVDGTLVRVTGHADYLRGLDLWEIKTSDKSIPADRHADSMQWRIYCLLFGVERVTYRLVQLAYEKSGVIYARSIDDVVLYPYPRLRHDVVMCLRDLLAFAELRGCLDAMEYFEDQEAGAA
jgi:hypothetical protein